MHTSDQRRLLLILVFFIIGVTIVAAKFLYVQYLNSAICLLPYLDRYVLWDKSAEHAHPALLLLYQMCLQLYTCVCI